MNRYVKIIFIIAISLLADSFVTAQSVVWRQVYGGPYIDQSYNCIELKDGGYMATGIKELFVPDNLTFIHKAFITIFDRNGFILKDKYLGDSLSEGEAFTLIQDSFGNIYLPYTSSSGMNLTKLDQNGNVLWEKLYTSYSILFFRGIQLVDNNKNLVILSLNKVLGIYPTSAITKIDSSGNLIWTKSYYDSIPINSFYTSYNNSFLFTDNSYYICGNKGDNPFIIKTDTSGNIIWNKRYLDNRGIYSISQVSDNSYIASGSADDFNYLYCMKFDSSGDVYWRKNFRDDTVSNNIGFEKILKNYDGNFVLGTIHSIGYGRLVIIDSLGNILLSKLYNYPAGFYIAQNNFNNTKDSGYIISGSLDSNNAIPKININGIKQIDISIFKTDKNGKTVSIKINHSEISEELRINIYPNPYNLGFNFSLHLPISSNVKIDLFDISGRMVKQIMRNDLGNGNYNFNVKTPELGSGIYFLKTLINNKSYTNRIALIK